MATKRIATPPGQSDIVVEMTEKEEREFNEYRRKMVAKIEEDQRIATEKKEKKRKDLMKKLKLSESQMDDLLELAR